MMMGPFISSPLAELYQLIAQHPDMLADAQANPVTWSYLEPYSHGEQFGIGLAPEPTGLLAVAFACMSAMGRTRRRTAVQKLSISQF
jgi:hypothetical protein